MCEAAKVSARERLAGGLPSYTLESSREKRGDDAYSAWPYQEQRATGSSGLPPQEPSSLFVKRAAAAVKAWGVSEETVGRSRGRAGAASVSSI